MLRFQSAIREHSLSNRVQTVSLTLSSDRSLVGERSDPVACRTKQETGYLGQLIKHSSSLIQCSAASHFCRVNSSFPSSTTSVVLLAVQDPENSQEQVDDIQVKADRSSNLLLHMVMTHHQLRIHKDISAKDEGTYDTIA
jgi:hypothetical protein